MLDHGHIYLEQIIPDHAPPDEALPTRLYTQKADNETFGIAPLSNKIFNDTVNLFSHDGTWKIFPSPTISSIYMAPNFPEPENKHSAFDILGDDRRLWYDSC